MVPDSFVGTAVFTPDSYTLVTGERNGKVLVWQRDTWEKKPYMPAGSNSSGIVVLSPDGKVVVTVCGDDGAVTGRDRVGLELLAFS